MYSYVRVNERRSARADAVVARRRAAVAVARRRDFMG
jgi:hypothetical protein